MQPIRILCSAIRLRIAPMPMGGSGGHDRRILIRDESTLHARYLEISSTEVLRKGGGEGRGGEGRGLLRVKMWKNGIASDQLVLGGGGGKPSRPSPAFSSPLPYPPPSSAVLTMLLRGLKGLSVGLLKSDLDNANRPKDGWAANGTGISLC